MKSIVWAAILAFGASTALAHGPYWGPGPRFGFYVYPPAPPPAYYYYRPPVVPVPAPGVVITPPPVYGPPPVYYPPVAPAPVGIWFGS